jgi:2,5-diketo-D-gluconate reductase A
MTVPHITLSGGVHIPQVGFGVFQIPDDQTQAAVEHALEAGYRHIDTAAAYGNERAVGAALRASGVPRDEVFVTTKLRNGEQGTEATLAAYDDSRRRLGLDVVDLYLIHWPVPAWGRYVETWKALERLHAEGAVRAVGVSNFLPPHLETLMESAEVTPAVNQIELHPTFQQRATQDAGRAHGIAVEAYAPLGQAKDLDQHAVLEAAQAHDVTPGQVVLRWHVQQGTVVIPKSVTPERIRANIDLFGFELTPAQMEAISALDTDQRMFPDPETADFSML